MSSEFAGNIREGNRDQFVAGIAGVQPVDVITPLYLGKILMQLNSLQQSLPGLPDLIVIALPFAEEVPVGFFKFHIFVSLF